MEVASFHDFLNSAAMRYSVVQVSAENRAIFLEKAAFICGFLLSKCFCFSSTVSLYVYNTEVAVPK